MPSSELQETTSYTLASLGKLLPPPNPELRAALLAGTSEAELVRLGAHVDCSRFLADAERLYGMAYAFWMKAPKAQRLMLRGFSEELLSIAVHEAIALAEAKRAREIAPMRDEAAHARRTAQVTRAYDEAITLRDQAEHVLRDVAGGDAVLLAEIGHAVATGDHDEGIALGLERLAALGERIFAAGGLELRRRSQLFSFDVQYVAQLTAAAANLRKVGGSVAARLAKLSAFGPPGRDEGFNMQLLTAIVRAFESGHDRDPVVPRLVPIATRRLFGRRTAAAKSSAQAAGTLRLADTEA